MRCGRRRAEHDGDVAAAVRSWMEETGPPPAPGDIVAQLNFGFWRFLVATRYTHDLWHDAVRHAFPNASDLRELEPGAEITHLEVRGWITD